MSMIRRSFRILMVLMLLTATCREQKIPTAVSRKIKNIILISVDTLRPDALSIYGGRTRTPFFEEFARRAVVFDHAFTPAPITLPAHTSLMTGLYPPSHGVRHNGVFKVGQNLPLLARLAKENGYRTAAFVGGFPLASQFGLNQGFDVYDDRFHTQNSAKGVFEYAERNSEEVRVAAEQWLSDKTGAPEQPIFLWLHFFDPHHPYLDHGFSEMAPYQQEVLYVDQQLQKLFAFFKGKKLDANSLIVITADHGEAFDEHGEVSHSLFVYNTTLHIPLLIAAPGISAARNSDIVRIVDIAPTIIDLKKWKMPPKLDGISLVTLLQDGKAAPQWSYSETLAPAIDFGWSPLFCIQNSTGKYIQAPKPEFYDLKQDPGENKNQIGTTRIEDFSKQIRAVLNHTKGVGTSPALSPEEREQLRSLGYFATAPGKIDPSATDPKDRVQIARKIASLSLDPVSPERKVKQYEEIVALEPRNPLLNLRYAEILLELKRYDRAEKIFRRVLQLHYPAAAVYNGLAASLYYRNHINDAEKILRQAITAGVADGETYYNMAEFLFQRGDREEAFGYYDQSMKLGYMPAFFRKARLKAVLGDFDEALRILARAEADQPDVAQINQERGMIYFRRNLLNEAIAEFQKALQKDPRSTELLYNIGISYYRMRDHSKSRQFLEEFLKTSSADLKQERELARKILAETK